MENSSDPDREGVEEYWLSLPINNCRFNLPALLRLTAATALACAMLFTAKGGTVIGWGGNEVGQISFGGQRAKAIAAGTRHSLLLREDGTVAGYGAWGWLFDGDPPVTIPPQLDRVVAVAAGCYHSLALRDDGTVVAWGLNNGGGTNLPPDLTNVVQIATYSCLRNSSLALTSDGRVVAWGADTPPVPSGLSNIVAVSVGGQGYGYAPPSGGLALKADGTVVGWGWGPTISNGLGSLTNIVAISGGFETALALTAEGKVVGMDWQYQPPADLSNVVKIAASQGDDHHINLALKADGKVVGWGYDFYRPPYGQMYGGVSFASDSVSNATAIASGYNHALALVGDGPPLVHARIAAQRTPDGLAVTVPTKSGQVYALEYTTSLEQPDWKILFPLAAGDGTTRSLLDPSLSDRQRFYRVRTW